MQKLYSVEREAPEQNLSVEDRYALRQAKTLPVIEELENWLLSERLQALPKSAIGKAIFYLIPRAYKIAMYMTDGKLEIDNKFAENLIRPVALGRKNGPKMRFYLQFICLPAAMPTLNGQLLCIVCWLVAN
jgi:hypothetical protein